MVKNPPTVDLLTRGLVVPPEGTLGVYRSKIGPSQHKVTTSSPITNTTTIYCKILCLTPVTTKKRPPLAEAEVVDEIETITASVEEVSLSENTPDEQRKSTDNDADIYYNYWKSNSKNVQITEL